MTRIHRFITEKAGEKGLSGRVIQNALKGNAAANRQAIALLEVDGYISASPHRALKPYDPDGDDQ